MKTITLQNFLYESNRAGYAGGYSKRWIKEKDGSTTIKFELGDWKSHDNFFGGEPYGGRIIVTKRNKPHWMMVYYGWVKKGIDPNAVYPILQGALKLMPKEAPFRGPSEFKKEDYVYKNRWTGKIGKYLGDEKILLGNKIIYRAYYMGGFVDRKI